MEDPFGKKKKEIDEFYSKQLKAVKTKDELDEKIDESNPFGQLHEQVNLALAPLQPENISNRQINQIHIVNKQHFDLRPLNLKDKIVAEHYDKYLILNEIRQKEKILRINAKKDKFNESTQLGVSDPQTEL